MSEHPLRIVLPKGRIQEKVSRLMAEIGLEVRISAARAYRGRCADPSVSLKLLKARNIPQLLALGRHDCGFTGLDWIEETQAEVEVLLDLGYDPVRIVAAMPEGRELPRGTQDSEAPPPPLVVATEYVEMTRRWLTQEKVPHLLIQTFGATEVFPPEDADLIVDNTATGATLEANGLRIVAELLRSSTRFVAAPQALKEPAKRKRIEEMAMLMESVLRAESKVLVEMNVSAEAYETLIPALPAMRAPTVSPLFGEQGYAVKIAVPRNEVPALLVRLKAAGAQDILVYELTKLLP